MRMSILGPTIVVAMFWSATSWAQSTHTTSPLAEASQRECSSSLLARSEMQTPKPIPVIRPLRFQEIPATLGATRGTQDQSVAAVHAPPNAENQQESEPALVVVPQTEVAH